MSLFKHALRSIPLVLAVLVVSLPVQADVERGENATVAASEASAAIDINLATEAELAKLTRVGPKKAQEIVRYREVNGPFEQVEDLARVKGIGPKTVEVNRSRLLVAQ